MIKIKFSIIYTNLSLVCIDSRDGEAGIFQVVRTEKYNIIALVHWAYVDYCQ